MGVAGQTTQGPVAYVACYMSTLPMTSSQSQSEQEGTGNSHCVNEVWDSPFHEET